MDSRFQKTKFKIMIPVIGQLHGFFRSLGDIVSTGARCSTNQPTTPVVFGVTTSQSLSSINLSQFTFLTNTSVNSFLVQFSWPLVPEHPPFRRHHGKYYVHCQNFSINWVVWYPRGFEHPIWRYSTADSQISRRQVQRALKNFKSVDVSNNFGPPPTSYIDIMKIGSSIQVTVNLRFSSDITFKPEDTLTFGVNGDMSNPQKVEETISLTNSFDDSESDI